jgi:hypothetical protein
MTFIILPACVMVRLVMSLWLNYNVALSCSLLVAFK